jgi:hypothetical protein
MHRDRQRLAVRRKSYGAKPPRVLVVHRQRERIFFLAAGRVDQADAAFIDVDIGLGIVAEESAVGALLRRGYQRGDLALDRVGQRIAQDRLRRQRLAMPIEPLRILGEGDGSRCQCRQNADEKPTHGNSCGLACRLRLGVRATPRER